MKSVLLQELAPALFHVEHSKNKMIRLSSPADSFSLFAIFAVLGLLRAGFRRRLPRKVSNADAPRGRQRFPSPLRVPWGEGNATRPASHAP
jgi:hypothetical protein